MYHSPKFILVIVTDEQLLISLIVDVVIFLAAVSGIILNVVKIIYSKKERNKIVRFLLIAVCLIAGILIIPEIRRNYNMYMNYTFVKGKITGFCTTEKKEAGVLFEYEINGNRYTNCNAFFPFPKDSLKINAECNVRVNLMEPQDGRIILK